MSLSVTNLAAIRGGRVLFKHLNFRVLPGQLVWVKGQNGAGKSTLLKMLAGLLQPEQGAIFWKDQKINNSIKSYHENVSYMAHCDGLKRVLTVSENIDLNLCLHQGQVSIQAKNDLLCKLDLKKVCDLNVVHLSAGQKRKLWMAMIALQNKPLWLLDEPFAMLDEGSVKRLCEILAQHLKQNGMVVLVSHQENFDYHHKIDLSSKDAVI